MTLNLEGRIPAKIFSRRSRSASRKTERNKWITGRGWIETFWKPPQFPTRADLDKIAPDNPVFLTRADGHAAVVNSAALKLANIDHHTPIHSADKS
jgi:predicted amidohydrolase YtcJ